MRLIGPSDGNQNVRVPTFSFTVEGRASAELPPLMAEQRIALSSGHFYAKRLVEAIGIEDADDGVVRASMAHYNTVEEVDRLTEALDNVL